MRRILMLILILMMAGCQQATVYDNDFEWVTYENPDFGISFEYPSYYGEPFEVVNKGTTGESFYLRFLFDYLPDDPYLVYINGTTLDYANPQPNVRVPYKGEYSLVDYCKEEMDFIPFIDEKGEKCETLFYNNDESTGMLQNVAILDIVTNSIERIFFANFPEGYNYNGLQVGFIVPFDYVEFEPFAKAELRGDIAVNDIIMRMDEWDLPRNLLTELSRFEELLMSIEYIN